MGRTRSSARKGKANKAAEEEEGAHEAESPATEKRKRTTRDAKASPSVAESPAKRTTRTQTPRKATRSSARKENNSDSDEQGDDGEQAENGGEEEEDEVVSTPRTRKTRAARSAAKKTQRVDRRAGCKDGSGEKVDGSEEKEKEKEEEEATKGATSGVGADQALKVAKQDEAAESSDEQKSKPDGQQKQHQKAAAAAELSQEEDAEAQQPSGEVKASSAAATQGDGSRKNTDGDAENADNDSDDDDSNNNNNEGKGKGKQSNAREREAQHVLHRVEAQTRRRERVERAVDRQVENTTSFPVPTMDNPDATFHDLEARQRAREKIDARKGTDAQHAPSAAGQRPMDARKRKLLELRARMSKGRMENHSAVMQEHQTNNNKGARRHLQRAEWEAESAARKRELEAMGLDKDHNYMVETADAAQAREAAKRQKRDRQAANGLVVFGQESLYRAYNKSLAKLPTVAGSAAANRVTDMADFGRAGNSDSREGIERVARDLREREERKAQRKKEREHVEYLEDETVTSINRRNEVYNRRLGRAFDKYTGEIRQNLERGTALH